MRLAAQAALVSVGRIRTGYIVSALTVLFLLFDGVIKLLNIPEALEMFAGLGYPASLAPVIGILQLACLAVYVIPRTSVLGAVLLTGFLGGAAATKVRLEDPWFLFAVGMGVLVWWGLFLREDRLRTLVPLRRY